MSKIGVIGDIHANLTALNAVLEVLDREGCDSLVCTGDVVGYGPSPGECIRIVRDRAIPCVLGNHDHYVTLIMDPRLEKLRETIRRSIEWTQGVLPMSDLKWLAQLPKRLDLDGFSLVHDAFGPKRWVYLTDERTLTYNFAHQDVPLAFCGHSHQPMLAHTRPEQPPVLTYLKSTRLPSADKVIINAGSVGQPRDKDPRAACGIYDTDERSIRLIRVVYDIEETQALMRQASLPEPFVLRLTVGR